MKSSISYLGWGVSLLLPAVLMLSSCGETKPENTVSAPSAPASPATSPKAAMTPGVPATVTATTGAAGTAATGTTAATTKTAQVGTAPQGTACPSNAPVKGKSSDRGKIYHVPKSNNYEKVKPTACFADVAAAEKAGYRAPKESTAPKEPAKQ